MHRIDTPGNVLGKFSEGNPAVGQEATQLGAAWFNDTQENLAYLVEAAGIPLVKGDEEQLYDAVIALIAGVVGTGGGEVPTTRTVTGGGLITGGGALVADLVLSLAKASAAEITAGSEDGKAITPKGLKDSAAAGMASGYYLSPGGLLIQWGNVRGSFSEGPVSVTFPIAFPEALLSVVATAYNPGASTGNDHWTQRSTGSLSGFTAVSQFSGNGVTGYGFDYIALGK